MQMLARLSCEALSSHGVAFDWYVIRSYPQLPIQIIRKRKRDETARNDDVKNLLSVYVDTSLICAGSYLLICCLSEGIRLDDLETVLLRTGGVRIPSRSVTEEPKGAPNLFKKDTDIFHGSISLPPDSSGTCVFDPIVIDDCDEPESSESEVNPTYDQQRCPPKSSQKRTIEGSVSRTSTAPASANAVRCSGRQPSPSYAFLLFTI